MAQLVSIIDYGSGNLRSVQKAFERVAGELGQPYQIDVTSSPDAVRKSDHVVLPGVGAFADCRSGLDAVPGMVEALTERVLKGGQPFLGICVGMQLMADIGREKRDAPGLGWIPGEVVPIEPKDGLKVPQIGWNSLDVTQPHPVLDDLSLGADGLNAYFVHSYHFVPEHGEHLIATTGYGGPITAIVGRDNIIGTQFHPEKSQRLGLGLLSRFLQWKP